MDRLTVVASEDVSMSIPQLPIFMNRQHTEYSKACSSGNSIQDARRILMETAEILSRIPKCRGVNNACGASLKYIQVNMIFFFVFLTIFLNRIESRVSSLERSPSLTVTSESLMNERFPFF